MTSADWPEILLDARELVHSQRHSRWQGRRSRAYARYRHLLSMQFFATYQEDSPADRDACDTSCREEVAAYYREVMVHKVAECLSSKKREETAP